MIQCPPIDPRIPLTQKNKRKVVFFVGVCSIIAIYSHLYGNAIFGVICVKKKDLSLLGLSRLCWHFFRHFLGKRAFFFSFFLEKELLAFSVIFHDCDPDFSTQNSEG